MAVIKIALCAAVLPAVFAVPQHAHMGHGPYKARSLPSGFPTGFPHPSGTAPYPANNGTLGGPTSTGGAGPVTIQSTINIVPLPLTHTEYVASSTAGVSEAGASGSAGSGLGSGGSGSGIGESGAACGPATVTVTQANTVTVTVPSSNGASPSEAPIQSSPAASSIAGAPSSAPYPIGNSSVPAGPTGTASVGTGLPSIPYQAPVPVVSTSAAPVEAATSATSSAAIVPTSSVVAHAYYAPQHHHSYVPPPVVSSSIPMVFPAPVASPSSSSAPAEEAITSAPAPVVSSSASPVASSAPTSSSSAPVKSDSSVKARGVLYGGTSGSTAISNANSYLGAGNGAMGWGWNWDSSPSPQSGAATGTLNVQFVPMLLSAIDTHTSIWDGNSAGAEYLMGFNEPDMTTDKGGSQMDYNTCASNWMTYMQPKQGSAKLISPATTNNMDDTAMGVHYMANFLDACITQKGCHIDVLAFHYYGEASDMDALKTTVAAYQKLQTQYKIPELWIPEMAPNEAPTADQMSAFLSFLDDPSNGVTRYAFNGLNTGTGQSLDDGVIKTAYQA